MSDRDLYQKKMQAKLDEWKAILDVLKARASGLSADAQLEMREQVKSLENKIQEGKTKLAELREAGEDSWESVKQGVESAWDALKSAVGDAAAKFKG